MFIFRKEKVNKIVCGDYHTKLFDETIYSVELSGATIHGFFAKIPTRRGCDDMGFAIRRHNWPCRTRELDDSSDEPARRPLFNLRPPWIRPEQDTVT